MVAGILILMLGEIMIVIEEKTGIVDLDNSESLAWTVYPGIAAIVAGLAFVISRKKPTFSVDEGRPFNDPIMNI